MSTDLAGHQALVALTAYMAENGYSPKAIAYAVEKPHKHADIALTALAVHEHEVQTNHTVLASLADLEHYCNECEWVWLPPADTEDIT